MELNNKVYITKINKNFNTLYSYWTSEFILQYKGTFLTYACINFILYLNVNEERDYSEYIIYQRLFAFFFSFLGFSHFRFNYLNDSETTTTTIKLNTK